MGGHAGSAEPLLAVRELCAYASGAGPGETSGPGSGSGPDEGEAMLLDGLSLTVDAGTVTAVVGPSGSGKTTLGLGALAASRTGVRLDGQVRLERTELLALPERCRRALRAGTAAHLPQHPETVLDPLRRIGGTLTELAALADRSHQPYADRPAREAKNAGDAGDAKNASVTTALEAAGLPHTAGLRRRFPHQLSGGQQQRAALASALVTGARLLVLDEPTSGLDPVTAGGLAHRLRRLVASGTGLLLLSHDLPFVRELADRVTVLEHGRAVDQGPTADLLTGGGGTAHPLTRDLVRAGRPRTAAAPTPAEAAPTPAEAAPTPAEAASAPARPPAPYVTAHEVSVRHRGRGPSPLHGPVTLSFPAGSVTALVGPSGAGKTTFGRLLAGLTPATTGRLRYGCGPGSGHRQDADRLPRRIQRRSPDQRRAVQYVHQAGAGSFEAHRPLLAQLATAARVLRGLTADAAEAEATATAARLGLEATLLHRTPDRLSGGQLQRCTLVRALLARPALLVCDEATSALDTLTRERVLAALPDLLAPARTALLLITHDLDAVRSRCDTVAVLDGGRCVQHARVADFLSAPLPGAPAELVRAARRQDDLRAGFTGVAGHPP